MFCSLCRCTNTLQPSNESKVWNCEPNVLYRPDTVRNHMYPSVDAARTMHGDTIQSELLLTSSYFVRREKEIEDQRDGVLTKVLCSIYWLCKEEVAHGKLNSMLKLLEIIGLTDIKDFTKKSNTVLKELVLTLGDQLMEVIIQEIKKSNVYGLLTDEVTDLSNTLQLVTFIKYYDQNLGDAGTHFVDVSDVFEGSVDTTATAETIHDCLINLLNSLDLKIQNARAFTSDGASVMTGHQSGVAARLSEHENCQTMLSVHCMCHRLALACSDTGDELTYIQEYEKTLLQLWKFFKNSPKRLKIYIKTALSMRDFDTLPAKRKKNIVKRVKKTCRTRWLSLLASVDAIYEEYVGLTHCLRSIQEQDKSSGGAMASGLLKKMDSVEFLGLFYTMKFMLPSLTAHSKTFQTGAVNFSRIRPNLEKAKAQLQNTATQQTVLKNLKSDMNGRLALCELNMSGHQEKVMKHLYICFY